MSSQQTKVVFSDDPTTFELVFSEQTELVRFSSDTIGIDEIRTVTSEAYRRPQEGHTEKHIVLAGLKITVEAQQAALKVIEEPPKGISITFVLPVGTQLLETVLSRVQTETHIETVEEVFGNWKKLSFNDRMAEIEEKIKSKDTGWLQQFKAGLLKFCEDHKKLSGSELKEVQLVVENLLTRGASNKMLLEHLALSIPLTR